MKERIGIVAYDDVSNDKNKYLLAFKNFYQSSERYEFVIAWSSVQELIGLVQEQGVSTINELNRILIFDAAFEDQINVNNMVNEIVSLEEIFQQRGARLPFLSFCTTNQEVFDAFKLDVSPEGHDLFPYPKTRVHKLEVNQSGGFNMGQLNQVLAGELDASALGIRNDYEGRETFAKRNQENFEKRALNSKAAQIEQIIKHANNKDNIAQKETAQTKADKLAQELINRNKTNQENSINSRQNLAKNTVQNQSNNNIQSNNSNIRPNIEQNNQENVQTRRKIKPINIEDNIHQKILSKNEALLNQDKFKTKEKSNDIVTQIRQYSNQLRNKSSLNFDTKLLNDTGVMVVGGLPGSGVSSIVANLGKLYSLINKKVLIVNLSNNDHITRYFHDYHDRYKELNRNQSLITKFRTNISEISVPVENNLELISDSGDIQKAYTIKERLSNLELILRNMRQYQIVIFLAGENFENVVLNISKEKVDDLIVVSTQDDLKEIQYDLIIDKKKYDAKLKSFDKSVGVIINKIQYKTNAYDTSKKIKLLTSPFDRMRLIGLIEYDNEWFTQSESGYLLVPRSIKQRFIFEKIIENILLKNISD